MKSTDILGRDVRTAQAMVGCGKTKIYELINCGELEARKIGRRTIITELSIQQYFAKLPSSVSSLAANNRRQGAK